MWPCVQGCLSKCNGAISLQLRPQLSLRLNVHRKFRKYRKL